MPEAKGVGMVDFGKAWADLNLDGYLAYARDLLITETPWPLALDTPDATVTSDSWDGRCNNMFFGALSWLLLHEIGHVHHRHQKFVPAGQRVRQEVQADGFATAWALDEAGQGLQREFRVLMIVTALAWLFLCEETYGQSPIHPATFLRFRDAVAQFDLEARSAALENASYLLKALFDPANPDMPKRQTARQAFDWMAGRLEALFPVR